ncbi:MAG TPA: FimV/HubP family polar landmark protein [Burkholderiaceae bacterium]|nr:FimV/HubP family polar landmark protein [Burkholderiaceae bacterium]
MASHSFKRAPMWRALALVISLTCTVPVAQAAGLGRLTVQSALGQPLRAEVEVTSVSRDEAGSLAVRLASQSAFRQANLEFNPALAILRFTLDRRGDRYVVQISSAQPINEPYLDVLLELTWATGRVLREYTVLLDPPSLRATPDVITPVAPPAAVAPAPAPAPVAQAPAPAAAPVTPPAAEVQPAPAPAAPPPAAVAPPPAARPAPAPSTPAPVAEGTVYTVKPGDTLGKIALRTKSPSVSLDQMLVAMFRANPNAFTGNNMNRLLAGRMLTIPSTAEAEAVTQEEARQEVVAQSADFAQYRSRLAQMASAAAQVAPAAPAAGQGRITAQVEDKSAPPKTGDQLQIAKVEEKAAASAAAAAAAKRDEEVARQRALKEQAERAAELQRANEQLKKAVELQSKAGAQVQAQAEAKVEPPKAAQPAEPAAPPKVETPPAEAPKAQAPAAVEPMKAEPVKSEVAKVEPPPAETKKAAPPAEPESSGPSILESLTDSNSLLLIGGLVAALGLLVGLNIYRKRRVEKTEEFRATGEGLRANSLFGQTGGQSVDTGATSTFNSSFIPAASQLDSNEVDPVAEADVYIAYGREEQAEDILKEALRMQPDRHAVRLKLLEIYSRRGDRASFDAVAEELRIRTAGIGDEWERAQKLGRALDPANPQYAGPAAAAEAAMRGPTTELRLNPTTVSPRQTPPAIAPILIEPAVQPEETSALGPISVTAKLLPETRMTDTAMPVDSHMRDTEMPLDTTGRAAPAQIVTPFSAPMSPPAFAEPGFKEPAFKEPAFTASFDTAPAASAKKEVGTIEAYGAGGGANKIDFAALDFDLGSNTSTPAGTPSQMPPSLTFPSGFDLNLDTTQPRTTQPPAAAIPTVELAFPPAQAPVTAAPTATGRSVIPDVDLSLPRATPPAFAMPASTPQPLAPAMAPSAAAASALEEALARPTLLGDVGALPDEQAPRLTSNTDQATVPLIDFDLTGSDVELGGRRTETQAGSPMAAQMATKLDLARGYIDLGVKDGARELLEEVMRDGTREQRQQAVDLLKQVEV